jgi:hypothetical protein
MAGLGPFRVGDKPAEALDLVVGRPEDDTPLSGFTTGTVRMRKPDRSEITWAGTLEQPKTVRSSWPNDPFTLPGQYRVRAELAGNAGILERSSWVRFWVRPA